jgi:hypothetical protein
MSYVFVGVAAFQLTSGLQQAETIRENGKLTREIADMNAEFAEIDSFHAEQDGGTQAAAYEGKADQVQSDQVVAYTSKDVDVSFGTAAEVIADSKLATFLNVVDIKNQAHRKALGYKDQARQYITGGVLAQAQSQLNASATQNSAIIGAATTAASGYSKYLDRKDKLVTKNSTTTPSATGLDNITGHRHWSNMTRDE